MPYALLVANILYINQFPDREADRASGKLHWVARLQPETAAWGYALILLLAAGALVGGIVLNALPFAAAFALVAWVPAVQAWRQLRQFAGTPEHLAPAIKLTLLAAHALPLMLALILLLTGRHS
jgi:1,4-dihydroxy-2-naphthoate octaprenyltransferase